MSRQFHPVFDPCKSVAKMPCFEFVQKLREDASMSNQFHPCFIGVHPWLSKYLAPSEAQPRWP